MELKMWKIGPKLSYDKTVLIGRGRFATVFKGLFEGVKPVAIKRIQRAFIFRTSFIDEEPKIMLTVSDHPNILRYFCYERNDNFYFIATELCSGTLEDYFNGKYQGPRFENEKKMLHQLTKGLAHLHRMDVIHRDIKPTNIMISTLFSGELVKPQIKLADFGIKYNILRPGVGENEDIELLGVNESLTNPNGTRGWMAPEMYNSEHFNFKADIFPLGCVFGFTLTGGRHPFGDDPMERADRIERGEGAMDLVVGDLNTPQSDKNAAFELINSMVNWDPNGRPSAEEILNNIYFQRSAGQLHENPQGNRISYNEGQLIAEGTRGIFVYRGLFDSQPVAVKRFQKSIVDNKSTVQHEADLMVIASDHPNILRYICYEMTGQFLLLATELCIGTLQNLVEGALTQVEHLFQGEKEILLQVTQGLAHLHSRSIIHRDVKPTNLLIYQQAPGMQPLMKVADFGISKILKKEQSDATNTNMTNPKGTRGWMAPEQYNSDRFDLKVDMFALGCVFGYMLSGGKHPFGDDIDDRIYFVKRGKPIVLTNDDLKEQYSGDGLSFHLIQSMLRMEPVNRPTALDVLDHAFFQL